MNYILNSDNMSLLFRQLLIGTRTTLQLFGFTLLFAVPLGVLVAVLRMSKHKWVSKPISAYILIMRGTPLMLQIVFIFYALPSWVSLDRFSAAVLAFSLNYAAYFGEIFRGGIQSISLGQYEAAQVLGFTRAQTFVRVILPQVVKIVLLSVSNEVMTLLKDTLLAQVIGVSELFRAAQNEQARTSMIEPLFVAGCFYLILNSIVTRLFGWAEKKLAYYR